jgi:Arylsulfotransferase (ASST)/Bacterial Ig-like domain/Kre9/KNH-like N-terminal Ig-like domain/Secretion system C-terminal sorting domain
MKKIISLTIIFIFGTASIWAQQIIYTSPRNNASYVTLQTSVILKSDLKIDAEALNSKFIKVIGSISGDHNGTISLSDDEQTIVFKPENNFSPGEEVTVSVNEGIKTIDGQLLKPLSIKFKTTPLSKPIPINPLSLVQGYAQKYETNIESSTLSFPKKINLDSLPSDFPKLTIGTSNNPSDEKIFLANFPFGTSDSLGYYLIIANNDGTIDHYKKLPQPSFDFKVQPNGDLSYAEVINNYGGYANVRWIVMDTSFAQVDSFQCGNGYNADLHDFLLLPNGDALLEAFDPEPVDMSQIVEGGDPNATVLGGIIQELDASHNVIFQWRSWDYIPITDSYEDLTGSTVDYLHMNAIDVDTGGNILASFRHLSQVIKINRQTGEVMWKMGGKENQFTFINEHESNAPNYFSYQHDVKHLANGNITLFDNGNQHSPQYSRAVEYKLDEQNKTATLVWEYRHNPDIFTMAMGDVQKLSNGNTVIGWGSAGSNGDPALTELSPADSIVLELSLPKGETSYRAYKFPWASKAPLAKVTESEFYAGNTYTFNNPGDTTGVTVTFDSISSYPYANATLTLYNYSPENPQFSGITPLLIKKYFNLAQQNVISFKAEMKIDLSNYPKINKPQETIVYARGIDNSKFYPLATNFDPGKNQLTVITSTFGDYAFGIPQNIDSAYSPVAISPKDKEIVNGEDPVKLMWGTRGIVNSYQLQVSSDSLFNTTLVDKDTITSTSFTLSSLVNNKKYFWRLRTNNPAGISSWSTPYSFSTASPFITVTYPNGNETLINDSTYIIRWQDNLSDTVNIELIKKGNTVNTIDSGIVSATNSYKWTVPSLLSPDSTYKIRITSKNNSSVFGISTNYFTISNKITGITNRNLIVKKYELYQNFPNPFNPSTSIKYSIASNSYIKIVIYNMIGQRIETLVNSFKEAGTYNINWDAGNLASGIYFYTINAISKDNGKNFYSVKKMILLK